MTTEFHILVGTMTGTAQLVAEEIQYALEGMGHSATVHMMENIAPSMFKSAGKFIVCTSTYGSGDIPDNGKPFYEALSGERPALQGVDYAVFGLGDSTYQQTYNFGGKKFEALLGELGATRIVESYFHNASGGTLPEEDCVEWAKSLVASLADSGVPA